MTVFFVLAAALLSVLLQWLSTRRGLGDVGGDCRFSTRLAEAGEPFSLVVTLTNRGRGLLPFLRFQLQVPPGVAVAQERGVSPLLRGGAVVSATTWLGPRQRFEKRIPASAGARGRYLLQGLKVSGGDFLGLSEYTESFGWGDELVVPPQGGPPGGGAVHRRLHQRGGSRFRPGGGAAGPLADQRQRECAGPALPGRGGGGALGE